MNMVELLQEGVRRKASDLHITVGVAPILRIDGDLVASGHPKLLPADTERLLAENAAAVQC